MSILSWFRDLLFDRRNYVELVKSYEESQERIRLLDAKVERLCKDLETKNAAFIESEGKVKELLLSVREQHMGDAILNTLMLLGLVKTERDDKDLIVESNDQRRVHDAMIRRGMASRGQGGSSLGNLVGAFRGGL